MGGDGAFELFNGHKVRLDDGSNSPEESVRRNAEDIPEQILFGLDMGVEAATLDFQLVVDIPHACARVPALGEQRLRRRQDFVFPLDGRVCHVIGLP